MKVIPQYKVICPSNYNWVIHVTLHDVATEPEGLVNAKL